MRAIVALAAAYALVVQATLLAIGGVAAGPAGFAAGTLCGQHNGAPAQGPSGAGEHDCCLAGCCGVSVPPAPAPVPALAYRLALSQPIVLVAVASGASLRFARAHRSRAPPFG